MASRRKHRPVQVNASRGTHPAAKNVRAIAELERTALHERSAADRVGDAIARTTGSAPFAVVHLAWFGSWVLLNTGRIPGITPFDPYPFSFLTLVVSLEAIFLSVFVLMSQNRMTRHAEKRAHLDLQVNLLAEQELTALPRTATRGLPQTWNRHQHLERGRPPPHGGDRCSSSGSDLGEEVAKSR